MAQPSSFARVNPLLTEAQKLATTLQQAEQNIANCEDPAVQGVYIYQMQETMGKIVEIQNKVGRSRNMDPADVGPIDEALNNCKSVQTRLDTLQIQLIEIQDLFESAHQAMGNKNQQALSDINQRLIVAHTNTNYNQGIRNSVATLQTNVQQALQGSGNQQYQQPTHTTTSTAYQPAPTITSTTTYQGDSVARNVISKLKATFEKLKQTPFDQKFDGILELLKTLHSYSENSEYTGIPEYEALYDEAQQILERMQYQQAQSEQVASFSRLSFGTPSQSAKLLDELRKSVHEFEQESTDAGKTTKLVAANGKMRSIKLSDEEKKKLFNEYMKLTTINPGFIKVAIDQWPGQLKNKLKAAENAFSAAPQTAQAPSQPSKAKNMLDRINAVLNTRPQAPAQTTSNSLISQPGEILTSIAQLKSSEERFRTYTTVLGTVGFKNATSLNTIVDGIKDTSIHLTQADAQAFKDVAGFKPEDLNRRPFLHLYFIHKNEDPTRLKGDHNHGENAFRNVNGATDEQRVRALKRTIFEVVLAGLERAVFNKDNAGINHFRGILEKIGPDPIDIPSGYEKYTDLLGEQYYLKHLAERHHNPALDDPHNTAKYGYEFGTNGFQAATQGSGLSADIQADAIQGVSDSVHRTFKLV